MSDATSNCHLAVDWGASGGKMAAATFDGKRLRCEDTLTFPNIPVQTPSALYWDIFALYRSVLDGIARYAAQGVRPATVGIDAWGATYGFLDRLGRLMEPVYHYRDVRTENIMDSVFETVSKRELFRLTGCQCNRTYTLPQLAACVAEENPVLWHADRLLFLPDLLSYFLTGISSNERTIAGTSALLNTRQDDWEPEVFHRFGIPQQFLSPLVDAGTVKGPLRSGIARDCGITGAQVVATVGHDSAAAVAAIPGFGPGKLYISIGTNISMGVEGSDPLVSDEAFRGGLKNTGGMEGRIITYRDFSAFWLINELQAAWRREGAAYSFDDLHQLAVDTPSPVVFVDTEYPAFNTPGGDMRAKIRDYLAKTGQPLIEAPGQFVRCVFESLALKIKYVAGYLERCTGIDHTEAFVINGGARNHLLVQLISDGLGLPVQAGMYYATLAGNLLCQLKASGSVASLSQMRAVSGNTFTMQPYQPENTAWWEEQLAGMVDRGIYSQ